MTYNVFMHGMKLAGIEIDRKVLADVAANDAAAFTALVNQARASLAQA
jgi:large subunit ribosomal protein L20